MKMKLVTLSALCILTSFATAQTLLYNNGATIKIQTGAVLYVEGGVENTATGILDNDGTLDIKGDLTNLGTWEATEPNTLKFTGAAHSNVNGGSAQFHNVVVQKDSSYNVSLVTTDMTINNNLDFNATGSTRMITGDKILKLGSAATVTGADSDEYIATTGTLGMVEKAVTADGSFTFPIGDSTNYTPLANVYTGTSYTSAKLSARSNDAIHPNKPDDATDYLSRYWEIDATGIGGYANTLTGTYATSGDLSGTTSLIKGAVYNGSEWSYADAALGTGTVIGSTTDTASDFTGSNFFGKVDLKAFLQGAYSGGVMTTHLPTLGQPTFPLASPYLDAPDTAISIPADVTDWVKIEFRQVGNPSNIIGKGSAFIKNDGSIVGLDGTAFARIKNGEPSAIVAVFHRNHLPIRTDIGLNTLDPVLHDFTTGLNQAYDNPGISTNESMIDLGSGVFGMWRANVNSDLNLNLTDLILTKQNTNPSQSNVYSPYDVNMDKNKNLTDFIQVKISTNPTKSAHQ